MPWGVDSTAGAFSLCLVNIPEAVSAFKGVEDHLWASLARSLYQLLPFLSSDNRWLLASRRLICGISPPWVSLAKFAPCILSRSTVISESPGVIDLVFSKSVLAH